MARKTTFRTGAEDAGTRLDQVLASRVAGLSRRQARVLLDIGGVFVDGQRVKVAGRIVRSDQRIDVYRGGALARASGAVGTTARERDAAGLPAYTVVYEDADLVVVDKPAGLLTAPTPESDRTNLADLLRRRVGAPLYVVHRIDLHTSGLLVFARTAPANRALAAQFRHHRVHREYVAVLVGRLPGDTVRIDLPIRDRRAVTHLVVEEHLGTCATVVRCRLETGRTHQIRLHCRHVGHPVVGDTTYGSPTPLDPPRMALHAAVLGFDHPRTHTPLRFASPLPTDLRVWLDTLRNASGPPHANQPRSEPV